MQRNIRTSSVGRLHFVFRGSRIPGVYISRGPGGLVVYVAPAVLVVFVGLLSGLLAHACR
jgi:hypothetical protein